MKKVLFIFALIMSMAFNMNAQTVNDTVYHNDTQIHFFLSPDTIASNVQVITLDSTWHPTNGYITFDVEGLTDSVILSLYIEDFEYTSYLDGWNVSEWCDTIYSDSIDHIDSSMYHPGNWAFDTVYCIDSIITHLDSVPNLTPYFQNGYNTFSVSEYDSIGIDSIAFAIVRLGGNDSVFVTISNLNFIDNYTITGIEDIDTPQILVYPNPVSSRVYINGEFDEVIIYNNIGHKITQTKNHNIDMTNYPKGIYFFRVNGKIIKVAKI